MNGNQFDALDRSVARYQHTPFGPLERSTVSYDTGTNPQGISNAGLMVSKADALGTVTNYAYDAMGRRASVSFSDGVTPARSYTFDPDGRTASITSGTYGNDTFTYDADGKEIQYQEGGGGNTTSPARVTYDYYPNGQRKALSVYSSALTQQNEFTYDYRNDGERTKLAVAGYGSPFSWTYTNAGRETAQSDPLTGTAAASYSPFANAYTYVPRSLQYNAYGQLATLTLANTGAYTNMTYDAEGNMLAASIVQPTQELPEPSM